MDRSALDGLIARSGIADLPDSDEVPHRLRMGEFSPMECVRVLTRLHGMTLSEAKRKLFESAAWADRTDGWTKLQDGLEEVHGVPVIAVGRGGG
ncbi:hypothetical protein GCM10022243_53850 [Saccharothrix violaceirubra]|uniref:Uncharacterized protein n=1 Tax=Saccharothrix violaceirubra TaxID=413306 RepID=A0A7W7SYT0_9PSEU|nr:hypothetical protein [Saccharothrix violaceirubra]MBB4963448.1 hypothetical protein [Saccharothrix violaceirubra]